ncbi:MAG: oxidoreductase, partial [Bacteroidales bacterium]|nr:oxidoreductase [Bacteroidales bacterium]
LYPLSDGMRKAGRRLGLIWTPEKLVRRALRALFRGRRTVSPGLVNALLPPLISILPARLIDKLGMRWINKTK